MSKSKTNIKKGSIQGIINKYRKLFLAVPLTLWFIFIVFPFIYSLILSLYSCQGTTCTFAPGVNIAKIFSDDLLWTAVLNTLTILILQVPIMIIMAIIFAVMLNNKKLKYSKIYRTMLFLPTVMGTVSFTVLFKIVLAQNGSLNSILMNMGIIEQPINWLIDSFWAMVCIIVIMTWRWVGYAMIYYLSGLQSVPEEIYEAAMIDGSSKIHTFFTITIPMLKPIIIFNMVTSTISTLQLFELPYLLTNGGPDNATITISMVIFRKSFTGIPDMGYASMMSYLIVIMVIILSIIQLKVSGNDD